MNSSKNMTALAARVMRALAVMLLAVMIVIPAVTVPSAAATTVTVTGGDNVAGGETFTVTVTYSGDSVGRVTADMTYDKSMLTYISGGSSTGNNGYIELRNAGTGEDIVFNIKFQALKGGSTALTVNTNEMFDLDEQYMSIPAATTKNVTISGDAAEDQIIKENVDLDEGYTPDVIGVDEKESSVNVTMVLAIGAAVAALLIIIIAIVIRRKR